MNKDADKKIFFLFKLPLLIHWITIFTLTSLPSDSLPGVGLWDKFEHFMAYFVLSFLLHLNLIIQNRFNLLKKYPILFSILIASLYAVFDELHQYFIPGRSADILDWLADFIGVIAGVLFAVIISNKYKIVNLYKFNLEPNTEKKVK